MITLDPDQFDQIMSFTNKDQAVGTLIAALVEDYEGANRQVVYYKAALDKANKQIKKLEKKLGMWTTLKEVTK
jgi:predicted  nucleic acid-binding Zn-ribbon protein